jgi:hypothetical protein
LATGLAVIDEISKALAVALWVGAIAILVPFYRAHHDRVLRYLTAVLVLFAVSRLFALTQQRTNAISLIVLNLLVLAAAYYEVRFFRTALHRERDEPPPRFRAETALVVTIAVLAVGSWALAPAYMRGNLAQPRYGANPAAFVFVASLIGYYIYVSARAILWIGKLCVAMYRGRGGQPPGPGSTVRVARIGFTVGIAVIGLAEILRLAADVDKFCAAVAIVTSPADTPYIQALYPLVDLCIRIGHTGFYLGALVPIVADIAQSVAVFRQQHRDFAVLQPLWHALTPAFPGIKFHHGRDRHYRCEVEIRDCIMLLGPYYSQEVATRARALAGHTPDSEVHVAAALIRAAQAARHAGEVAADPHPMPTSPATTRDEDIAWLVALARAFNHATTEPIVHV